MYCLLLGEAQRQSRCRRERNKNGNSDRRGLLHHLEAAAAGNHGEPALRLDLTMLQATYQLVERVVAPDIFTHQGDLAGRGGPCGGMNRAGLRVCRLPSRKRVERPVNCANVYCDACPDPRERTSDLSQVVHAAEAAAGAARHVASALLEPGEALFCDCHADPDTGFALLDF